jgi:predicted branched-subunit amino acid permease
MAPMLLAYLPFGLLVGAAVAASDNPVAAYLATWTIYGGAAHLAVLDVVGQGSGWMAAAAVGLLVNVRLSAYATAMAPDWRGASVGRRVAAGAMLTDAPWALARGHRPAGRREFYLGAGGVLFVGWPALVTLGVLAGQWVTALPVAGLLSAMSLGAIVVPQLRERPTTVAAGVAAVTAVLTAGLAAGPALLAAGVTGGAAGALTARAGQTERAGQTARTGRVAS